jgi:hypothetical protein
MLLCPSRSTPSHHHATPISTDVTYRATHIIAHIDGIHHSVVASITIVLTLMLHGGFILVKVAIFFDAKASQGVALEETQESMRGEPIQLWILHLIGTFTTASECETRCNPSHGESATCDTYPLAAKELLQARLASAKESAMAKVRKSRSPLSPTRR